MATEPRPPSPAAAGAQAPESSRAPGGPGAAAAEALALTPVEGQHDHTVDDKGRVSIPADFRQALGLDEGAELVVTRHLKERCLRVFTPAGWEAFKARAAQGDRSLNAAVQRVMVGSARRVKVDRLGRVQVPQVLRQFAALEGKCFVMGQGRFMELWDTNQWDLTHGPEQYAELDLSDLDA